MPLKTCRILVIVSKDACIVNEVVKNIKLYGVWYLI